MFQSWRNLLFLHWEVAPGLLATSLPPGLTLDLHEGRAYLGIVPFFMRNIRPRGLPSVPWISHFLELNVRTYVLGPGGVPGVWFYSLDTNRRIARMLGRGLFHLPYEDAEMRATVDAEGYVIYHARRLSSTRQATFRYRARGEFRMAAPGSIEEFLLERYSLFAWDARRERLHRGRVHHEKYRHADADLSEWSGAPAFWNGQDVGSAPPVHACVARDVDVSIYGIEEARP